MLIFEPLKIVQLNAAHRLTSNEVRYQKIVDKIVLYVHMHARIKCNGHNFTHEILIETVTVSINKLCTLNN